MSTQANYVIPFSILPEEDRSHFRLLELPPDLLEVLTSSPPSTLRFKSQEKTGESEADAGAVICTHDTTYNVRQVNTSNSVYICQPKALNQDNSDYDTGIPHSGLQAIAQGNWTLELSKANGTTAAPYLRAMLPTYSSTGTYQSKDLVSKQQAFDNVPLSQSECELAWRDLACFELSDPEGCFLPTAGARAQAWKSVVDQAVASGIDLTDGLSSSQLKLIVDENGDWPIELSYAVVRSVSVEADGSVAIEQSKCVTSIGLSQVEASSQTGRGLGVSDFLESWRDLLPEKWRAGAKLEALPRSQYTLGDDGKSVAFAGEAGGVGTSAASDGKVPTGAKRKWHDKFRASKKAE